MRTSLPPRRSCQAPGGPRGARVPATNRAYWQAKIARNMARDKTAKAELRKLGWKHAVVWECETRDPAKLARILDRKLGPGNSR